MSLEIFLGALFYMVAAASIAANAVLIWYIKRLLTLQEETAVELVENISVFQDELESLLNTDVLTGEPTLMKLLDDVKQFGANTEEIKLRLIPEEEGENN
jgi:hypothetical protein